jgi:plasmid stabilization system protein ParE
MSENRLDIHPDVLAVDISEITSFIMSDNPEAADAVLSRIDEAFVAVTSFPALGTLYHPGRKVLKGIRMIPATPYRNYLIFYRPLPDDAGVRILYVLHGARDIAGYIKDSGRQ